MSLFERAVTSVAFCWSVQRRDGAGLALTSCDTAIEIAGVRYEASPGMMPAAISRRSGFEAGSSEVSGAVSSAALSTEDLTAARWDGARFDLNAVDWETNEAVALSGGEIGEVGINGASFTADLRGVVAKLDAPICPSTSPTCRAEFGGLQCRVDLAGRSLRAAVLSSEGDRLTLDQVADGRFLFGRLRFLSGANCGLTRTIVASTGNSVRVRELAPHGIAAGDRIELREGCDKTFATCCARFDNALNFRGEPHVPGNDLLTRYPGA